MQSGTLRVIFGLSVAIAVPLAGQTTAQRQPIASIAGQPVYEDDLVPLVGPQLWQLKNQEFDLKSKALDNLVNQKLLEAEAKSRGVPVNKLLDQDVDSKLTAPTAGEIEAYYLAQKDRINRPLNDVKPQLEQALKEARRQQARQDYLDGLRQKAGVAILLKRPRMEVAPDPSRLRGNAKAPITIVEFSDFQCPYCQAAQQVVRQVLEKYEGKVRLSFRDLPLRQIHPQAQKAAEASRCAADQGKFWEYHDRLFANQSRLDPAGLLDHARATGLEMERFEACLNGERFKTMVENDLQTGMRAGVTGAPAFYINGVLLTGNQPFSAFEKIINSELAALKEPAQGTPGAQR